MTELNSNLKEAAVGALKDLLAMAPLEDGYLTNFLTVLKTIRNKNIILECSNASIKRDVFDTIRMDKVFFTDLMAASSSFALGLTDRDLAITHFVANCQGFTVNSLIIDNALIERVASSELLTKLLQSNIWLFFLFYLSTQEHMVFEQIMESGRGALVKQQGRKAR